MKVVRSKIQGYGCIATRTYDKGDLVSDVEGVVRHTDEKYDDTYSLYVDGSYLYDMVDQNRWINHCCEPNCRVEADFDEKGNAWARIVAIRDIVVGEELSYDYAFPYKLAEPCACGVKRCRGWIVDPDEVGKLEKLLKKKGKKRRPIKPKAPPKWALEFDKGAADKAAAKDKKKSKKKKPAKKKADKKKAAPKKAAQKKSEKKKSSKKSTTKVIHEVLTTAPSRRPHA